MNVRGMTEEVLDWIEPMLPRNRRDPMNTIIKLSEEVSELLHAQYTNDGDIGNEIADCLILLLDVAVLNDVDIAEEFRKKMAINRKRIWGKRNGALKHA